MCPNKTTGLSEEIPHPLLILCMSYYVALSCHSNPDSFDTFSRPRLCTCKPQVMTTSVLPVLIIV